MLTHLFLRMVSAVPSPAEVLECSLHHAWEPCLQGGREITGAHNELTPAREEPLALSGPPLPHCPVGPGQCFGHLLKPTEIQILPKNVSTESECKTTVSDFFLGKKQQLP